MTYVLGHVNIPNMTFNPAQPYDNLPLLPPKIQKEKFYEALLKARTELAELKGYSFSMPNPMLLISPSIIRESVASSEIENIHTTVVDVLENQLFPEAEQRESDKEVLRYRDALLWGFENFQQLSISTRLITGIKQKLLPKSKEGYRRDQNQIVNQATKEVIYTPPRPGEMSRLMSNWENFANQKEDDIDILLRCAIAHYQFEAIHPFEDGNGRTGRILMVLQLVNASVLSLPTLFISGYLIRNRNEYYRLLTAVTQEEKWDEFISFMLEGFYLQAKETKETLFHVMKLYAEFKEMMRQNHKKIYSADLVDVLFSYPIINPSKLAEELGIHYITAGKYLSRLAESSILKETRRGKYHLFINHQLLKAIQGERNSS